MKLYRLHRIQDLPIPPEEAWRFFSDPWNLPSITPPWLDFRLAPETPAEIGPGTILAYRLRPMMGIPATWITEITHVEPPRLFADEQRFGPYRFWHHLHRFTPLDSGVRMEDTVHYALPGGPLGRAVHALAVRGRLEGIFDYRRRELERRFVPGGAVRG